MISQIMQNFHSSDEVTKPGRGVLFVHLYPDVPEIKLWTTGGMPCVLRGEDFGKFVAWLKEQGFNV